MVTKNKDEWLNERVDSDQKMRIQYLIDSGDYENPGRFTREAIIEKLEPDKKKGFSNDELKDLIRQVLREDRGILIEPLQHLGFKFVLVK